MAKSYWTRIQTPDGLKYFRADEVTDELLQKIKDESSNVFWAEYDVTQFDDIKDAYDAGKSIYVVKSESRNSYIYSLKNYFHYESDPSMDQFLFTCMCQSEERLITCFTSNWNTSATRHFADYSDVSALSGSVAPRYSSIPCPIPEGTYATKNNVLYKANTTITSEGTYAEWDDSQWDRVTVGDELKELESLSKIAVFEVTFPSEVKTYPDPGEILAAINAGKYVVIDQPNLGVWEHTFWLLQRANQGPQDHIYFEWMDRILVAEKDNTVETPTWTWFEKDIGFAKTGSVAPEYADMTFPVAEGTACMHDGLRYVANTTISTAEAWTSAHWTETSIEDVIGNVDKWTEVQISSDSEAVSDFHWCKMYYNDALKMYSLNFWCTISNISSIALGWNKLFEVDIQDAPNILNFACRSRRGDHDVWVSENIVEQIGFIKVAGKVYLRLFNSDTTSSGERLYYAPTIQFPATYFSGT